MKTIPVALKAHYASGSTTLATALRITRQDGRVFGFTSSDVSERIDGVWYDAQQGLDISSLATTASLAVGNLELTTVDDGTLFDRRDILGRLWDNAAFLLFRYNWADPAQGSEALLAGTLGQVKLLRGSITCELRDLRQYLQQSIGAVTSKTCRARFADFPSQAGNARCGLSAAAWTDGLRVTSVIDERTFRVAVSTGAARANAWYDDGLLTWTSGDNVGLRSQIKSFNGFSPMEMTLLTAPPRAVQVGDYLQALAGCRKRLAEDCRDRFDNVVNFQGEPHLPGMDALTQTPEPRS